MRILGITSYNGSKYQGFQKQKGAITIQSKIEEALSMFFNSPIIIHASGRTDRGVHAFGQTFHFDIKKDYLDIDRLIYSINSILPPDIKIITFELVDSSFHARYSANKKEYMYIISTVDKDPFNYELIDLEKEPFDEKKFEQALILFIGEHNFMNFTSKKEDKDNFVRTIFDIEVIHDKENLLRVIISGNGFMQYMIRYIIGTSLAFARDKISIESLVCLIEVFSKKRTIVSYKAPASGLYLKKVFY